MRFALTEEQIALQSTVRAFLDKHAHREELRPQAGTAGFDREAWTRMAQELGLHGLAIPQRYGGAGASLVELVVTLEEMGRRLLCSPYLSTVVLAGTLLQESADEAACARWLPEIATGELVATLAIAEPGSSWPVEQTATTAEPYGGGWRLTGTKEFVIDGMTADVIFVTASTPQGVGVFAVNATAAGVRRTALPVLDQTRPLARVAFTSALACGALVPAGGYGSDTVSALLWRVRDIASVALAAEQVGAAQACLDMAVAHANSRVQFGRPIGSFQAVKHKCADMFVDVESSRALVHHAAWCAATGADDLPLAASTTRAYASDAYLRVAAQNLQVHGGIGYTWEHDAQLHFKRATASRRLLGSPHEHRERVARLLGMDAREPARSWSVVDR